METDGLFTIPLITDTALLPFYALFIMNKQDQDTKQDQGAIRR